MKHPFIESLLGWPIFDIDRKNSNYMHARRRKFCAISLQKQAIFWEIH